MGDAFVVNRQMYDLERWESEKKDIVSMKKKKMKKAEAFEYLKGTKVFCKDYDKMEAVQDFVRSLGFHWSDASEEMVLTHAIFLREEGRLSYTISPQYFRAHKSPELSADDILSIEIVEDTKPDCERNEHVKALQEFIAKSGCIDCIIISKNDFGILKK